MGDGAFAGAEGGDRSRGILHVLNDEWFMESTGWAFEQVAPGGNTFVAVGFDPATIRVPASAHVVGVENDRAGLQELDALIAGSRIAIFHNVSERIVGALASAPPSVLRVWSGWGGDYYGNSYDRFAGQLAPATRSVVHGAVRPTFWAGRALRAVRVSPRFHAAARASDVFSAPVPEDLAVFARRFPEFTGRYSQLNYATVEDTIATGPLPKLGSDILLGNSASPTNNHIDLLELLATTDLGDRRVIAPLSYGDPAYARSVALAGQTLLGDAFVPITGFLPLGEYNEMLAGCGTVILGHYRQEGVGNVLRALWQGARLVLDGRNPVAEHLLARGVAVGLVEQIRASGVADTPVPAGEMAARRRYLDENWSRAAVLRNVESLISMAPQG